MDTFKERLAYLWRDNLKPATIAKAIGMSQPGFSRIWYDGGLPNTETLIKIKESTGCNLNWLLTGDGDPYADTVSGLNDAKSSNATAAADPRGNPVNMEEFVFIPRYDVFAAAGHGYPVESEHPLFYMAFRRDWIEHYVSRELDKLSVIAVKGDSMEGVLNDGDTILVNHAATSPRDGLFVLRINNGLMVKRVQSIPGKLLITSANPAYAPFEIDLSDMGDNVAIIGRVEWFGRTTN